MIGKSFDEIYFNHSYMIKQEISTVLMKNNRKNDKNFFI